MPIELTSKAVSKVKEIMSQQEPQPVGLRVGVAGGGLLRIFVSNELRKPEQSHRQSVRIRWSESLCRPGLTHVPERDEDRLRGNLGRRRVQIREPKREDDLRLRQFLQRVSLLPVLLTPGALARRPGGFAFDTFKLPHSPPDAKKARPRDLRPRSPLKPNSSIACRPRFRRANSQLSSGIDELLSPAMTHVGAVQETPAFVVPLVCS